MYKKLVIVWAVAVLLFTTSSALCIDDNDSPTGKIELTEEEFRNMVYGRTDLLPAVKLGKHEYSALPSDLNSTITEPVLTCSDLFKEFMDKYDSIFQIWANRNCRDYFGVWCCPYGICYLFVVKPDILCNLNYPIYKPVIPVWEWPQVEVPQV